MSAVIAIVVVVVVAGLGLWVMTTYNTLVSERLKVHTQWSQVDVVLKQRFDVIPDLVETVKGYAKHENEALAAVTEARSRYLGAGGNPQAQQRANAELSGALGRLMAVAEAYPDLKANQNFLDLQQQISKIEEKLADFRQFYNDMVMRYNRLLITFPSALIANMFHFEKEDFFQVEESEKEKPVVKF